MTWFDNRDIMYILVVTYSRQGEGGERVQTIVTLVLSIEAEILAYLICKAIDDYINGGK